MEITTGTSNYKITDAGSLITFNNEDIQFKMFTDLYLVFSFKNDDKVEGTKMESEVINNKTLKLVFINFNNSLGVGNAVPLPIALVENQQLYLNVMIYSLSKESPKNIHYTFYLREEVKNG